ncbi:hypothetical protein RN001_007349 [Aquatica leii]|uniref:DDE Tnp4 domain-containing protein n=1 Tax=Aquatica leii TaxID=1421715 RepID=A0AAN7P9E8_9COLE|nr:hypothetical protein RN001_007349 [Aquatica leii]
MRFVLLTTLFIPFWQLFRLERRHIRDASNPFEIPDTVFKSLYRLPKQLAINLIAELEVFMVETVRSTSVPNALKVLCALHFYAHGSYQKSVGQDFFLGLSQTTVSRCIESVSEIISGQLSRRYLKFPRGVIGCIDCTHVAVIAPSLEHPQYPGYAYLNRKGYYSINVQIICDANLSILNCNTMYPGSTHDAAIWQMSTVQRYLRENHVRGTWLLGDSGYPLQPWLLTPIENAAEDSPEGRYTRAHIRTRNVVERCNGVLKNRFRCLLKHRALHYNPTKAAKIIYSCCVLHNILIKNNVEADEEMNMEDNGEYRNGHNRSVSLRTKQMSIRNGHFYSL